MTMTATQLKSYEEMLRTERVRILGNVERLHAELETSLSDDTSEHGHESHMGDVATATYLRERDLSIEEHEEHLLHEIDAALLRVTAGTYGTCSDCGIDIPEDRLAALPWAGRCIACQERAGQ